MCAYCVFAREDEVFLHLPVSQHSNSCLSDLQKEEGKVQGQLNHTDSNQYIRELKDQIAELQHEVRLVHRAAHPSAHELSFSSSKFRFRFSDLFGLFQKISEHDLRYGLTLRLTD